MRSLWLAGALLSAACSSSQATDLGVDLSTAGDLATVYPAGPYGNNVGDTIAPLVWEGYRNDTGDAVSTTKPYGNYSMDDLRRSGKAYAIVHISDFY
jgi:hypothetical protein